MQRLYFAQTIVAIYVLSDKKVAMLGLVLSYVTQVTGSLNWGVRQFAEVETHLNAIERLLEYTDRNPVAKKGDKKKQLFATESAAKLEGDPDVAQWPSQGQVSFSCVKLRYRDALPLALRGVNMCIDPGEKVGICGRTGSEILSLIVALFELWSSTREVSLLMA